MGTVGQGGFGGGIFSAGTLTITGSTISANSTGKDGVGGGMDNSGTLVMTNSTVSGNSTTGNGGSGGGLWNATTATLTNCTIVLNSAGASFGGAGIHQFNNSSVVNIRNTIVASNSLSGSPNGPDVDSTEPYNSQGHNLIGNGDGSTGFNASDQVGSGSSPLDPRLGPLANNGGLTQTHALNAGSPVLDAGDNCVFDNTCLPPYGFSLTTDQRGTGFARVVDGPDADTTVTVDIGAFEAQVSVADIANQTINEDGSLSLPFTVGGEASITSVTATSSNTSLVPNNPVNISISGSGSNRTLLINPVANTFATSTITVTVNGSNSQTMTDTFVLTVNPVNDPPSFAKGPDQTVNENDGAQTINNWATNISAGPANESGQTFTFVVVSNSNASLFAVAPAIGPNGTLTYTPATGVSGTALITIALMDNGGTTDGGINTSATQTFNINVSEGGTLQFSAATYSVSENAGPATITISRTGGSGGTATVLFSTSNGTATAADYTSVAQTVTFNDGEMTKTVNVSLTDDPLSEPDETIHLTLSNAGGSGQLGAPASGVLTILNDDPEGGIIRFSSATYLTTESSGSTLITVERSGDTSHAATVDYASVDGSPGSPCSTINGMASQKCDYTLAIGTLQFAAGETSKTFTVLLTQDSYVEGSEDFTLTLANPTGGAVFATPSTATLTIADDLTEPATNVIDDANDFVRQHYHDFLNREPEAGGLDYWTNEITRCGSDARCIHNRRIDVSAAFFVEAEFQQTAYFIYRMYLASFGRRPTYAEFTADRTLMDSGQINQSKQQFADLWVQRMAFTNFYAPSLSNTDFVNLLFDTAGLPGHATERQQEIDAMAAGKTRAQVVRDLDETTEFYDREYNGAFVAAQYFGYLRRDPDQAGYLFWLDVLSNREPNNFRAMVCAFLTSAEYQLRFGATVTRTNSDCAP